MTEDLLYLINQNENTAVEHASVIHKHNDISWNPIKIMSKWNENS